MNRGEYVQMEEYLSSWGSETSESESPFPWSHLTETVRSELLTSRTNKSAVI